MAAANPLWEFSLAAYARPGAAEACLRLQDGVGADVNLLLYFCWLATVREGSLDRAEIEEVVSRTAAWRDQVVRPLRAVRRRMKEGIAGMPPESAESLRSEVKRIELRSERLQQDLLFRLSGSAAPEPVAGPAAQRRAEENIVLYLEDIGASQSPDVARDVRIVIEAGLQDQR